MASLRFWISKVKFHCSISPVDIIVVTVSSAALSPYAPWRFAVRHPPGQRPKQSCLIVAADQHHVADSDSGWPLAAIRPLQKLPKIFRAEASPMALHQSLSILGSIGKRISVYIIYVGDTYLSVILEKHGRRQGLQVNHPIGQVREWPRVHDRLTVTQHSE
ncbi:hypothetical protein TTRE_0000480401 [Trichuris trichiura]|uniref:Uncharacterized protein n=1 Tax=Trichuris trichiura TaxID=36087 RepID=A0A077Z9R5_TRITR|nr:hypothetical protein TTRE_0000480401 [Trichuris trichiura]